MKCFFVFISIKTFTNFYLILKCILEKLVQYLFPDKKFRWKNDYFPFTDPSYEMEVKFYDDLDDNDDSAWLEIFGSGVIHKQILNNCNLSNYHGWAFGLGLERLSMLLFNIKDIRQFWSNDERFLSQFKDGKIKHFIPYSKYPACYKDISFYVNDQFVENNFMEIIGNIGGDIIEDVSMIDEYYNKKLNKTSKCYRINYRHTDRTLTNEEVNDLQAQIRNHIESQLNVEVRG